MKENMLKSSVGRGCKSKRVNKKEREIGLEWKEKGKREER